MMKFIVFFGLSYSALNWLLFAWSAMASVGGNKGFGSVQLQSLDTEKVLSGTGGLAQAFKAAGATATAAAMSLVGLLVAAIAAGIEKF
ncbi:hypothetical protein [Ralstonia pseudosolanacearum]|uniref:hypothetical protein n=1 Tax=Ralstonia pseudosolanacearum TaxID=1310165 RepID=UPI001FFBDE11|nr:hypothetical protein [Ralstonia pseudosolanacearum]